MNKNTQSICLWSGVALLPFIVGGWWLLAHLIPPPSPAWDAQQVAAMFTANSAGIRAGMILMFIGTGLFMPFFGLISAQIHRMEGVPPVLAYTQIIAAAMAVVIIFVPASLWVAAAFRLERDPDIILAMNDVAWLIFIMTFPPQVIQNLAIALAIFGDKSPKRIMPRWVAYVNIWTAFLLLPAGLVSFFKTGPFAWNGLLSFWVPTAMIGIWFTTMFLALRKAIAEQPVESGGAG